MVNLEFVHIGEEIKEVLARKLISKTALANMLEMSTTNVHKIFKRSSVDTGLLHRISIVLEHDFFLCYTTPSNKESALLKEIAIKDEIIRLLKKTNEFADFIIELQKPTTK